jgi:O-antigen/teichoic acid export membrane protein
MYQFFPIIIISFLGGDLLAGQFKIIDQVVSIFKTYLNMFFYFIYANICYELDKNYKKGLNIWKQYNGLNFVFLATLIILFYSFTPFILKFFKINILHFPNLIENFRLALVVPLLTAISLPLRQLMFGFDLQKIYIKITIIMTIFNFILLFLLTNIQGLRGAFLSIIIIEFIIIVLYAFVLFKNSKQTNYLE